MMNRRPKVLHNLVERPLQKKSANVRNRTGINNLPLELLSKILEYLSVSDILRCSVTCKHWLEACSQNEIWHIQFRRLPTKMQKLSVEATKPKSYTDWKKETISCLNKYRKKNIELILKKKSRYSGLPEKFADALKYLDVRWTIMMLDANGKEYELVTKVANYHTTSISICWNDIDLPIVGRLNTCSIYAQSPLFRDASGNVVENSACSRSLIAKLSLKGDAFNQTNIVGSDQYISAYVLSKGLIFGLWHDDLVHNKNIAFINLHLHSLRTVERILKGTSESSYNIPVHQPILDDIDGKYGLQRYFALIELRTSRKTLWSHKVMEFFKGQVEDGYLIMTDERAAYQSSFDISDHIRLPWKAGAIRGIIKDLAVLDFSLIDCNEEFLWHTSEVVKAIAAKTNDVSFEDGGENQIIVLNDEQKGWLKLNLALDPDSNCSAVRRIQVGLKISFINNWFGTKY